MKSIMLSIVTTLALFSVADTAQPAGGKPKLTPEQKAALLQKIQICKGGDKIAKPGTQRGTITIVNAQSKASSDWVAAAVAYLKRETHFNITLKPGELNPASPVVTGDMTLYVIDNPSLPRIVVAPDDRWAYCNVAKIYSDKAPFFEARTKKLVSRTFAMLCGGMSSTYGISLAGAMPNVSDMDVLPNEHIPVDVTVRMNTYMEKFGITPAVMKPYKMACQEGWAPQPTNDVQRMIWNQVHAIPDKPMKIEFDPKRDKDK